MGGEDGYDGVVPFETIVRKGILAKEIEERKQALVEQCRSNNGLTLQEVIDHNDWLLQIERDLSKARARIERDFRISNALSLKVHDCKRKAQLQQRLDVLRSQCDVLNECIHGLSDHCAWFQKSGTYREAVDYLEGRWDDEDGGPLDDCFDLRTDGSAGNANQEEASHHDLDGLIHSEHCLPSPQEKKSNRRKKKQKRRVATGGQAGPDAENGGRGAENSEEEEEEGDAQSEGEGLGGTSREREADELFAFAADFNWLRAAGRPNGRPHERKDQIGPWPVDVWAPD